MNFKALSVALMMSATLLPMPAMAYGTSGSRCYEDVWREEYVPGGYNRRGYVRRWQERVEIPCRRPRRHGYRPHHQPHHQPAPQHTQDNNSCLEGTIIGGLLGGGIGGAVSRGDGRWVAVPTGAILGGLIGCQIDGG